jgi:peptidoglycan hydrolase-like protein with peptidoglycan-binding domain
MNTLRKGDRGPEVSKLQKMLGIANPDEKFGLGTEAKVKEFQTNNNLTADGIVGPGTWAKIQSMFTSAELNSIGQTGILIPHGVLVGFNGDLLWVHKQEGHAGIPYWPGGISGITIDPGFDLGQMTPDRFVQLYKDIFSREQINQLIGVIGLKGDKAKNALANHPMRDIQITRHQADSVFPYAADPFWIALVKRFNELKIAPKSVHTALLSLGYNRGPGNKEMEVLSPLFIKKDWRGIANCIGSMQQTHIIPGIRTRRKAEAQLILNELK